MACKYTNPHTGNELYLSQRLQEYYKLDDSQDSSNFLDSKISLFYSDSFLEIFGDWISEKKNEDNRHDVDGAPKLFESNGNFYVIDKNNEKYFINNQRFEGLELYPDLYNKLGELKEDSASIITKYILDKYRNEDLDITDISNISFNLENEIISFFNDQIKENPEYQEHFDILKKFKSDFAEEVLDFLQTMNLSLNQIEDSDDTLYQEELAEDGSIVSKSSIEKNSKDNATSSIKLLMSLLSDYNNVSNFFASYKFIPFSKVWNDIQAQLVDIPKIKTLDNITPYEDMKNILLKLSSDKPYINDLIDILDSSSDNLKNQFVQAFYNNGKLIQDSTSYKNGTYKIVNAAESASKKSKILTEVGHEFKINFSTISTTTGKRIFDLDSYKNKILYPYLNIFRNESDNKGMYFRLLLANNKLKNDSINNELSNTVNELSYKIYTNFYQLLNNLGFNLDNEQYNYYLFNNINIENINNDVLLDKLKEFYSGFNFFNKAIINDITNPEKTINFATALLFNDKGVYFNPFKGEKNQQTSQKVFENIAESMAYLDVDMSENMFFSGDKSMWVYSLNSHIKDSVNILNNDMNYVKKLLTLPQTRNSLFLNKILEEKEKNSNSNPLELHRNNSFYHEDKPAEAVDNQTTSKRDAINRDIYETMLGKSTGKTILSTTTPSDKATGLKIGIKLFINSNISEKNNKIYFGDEVINIFSNYFLDDLLTAVEAKNFIYKNMDEKGNVDVSKLTQYKHVTANGNVFDVININGKSVLDSSINRNNINDLKSFIENNSNKGYRLIFAGNVFKNFLTPDLSPENLFKSKDSDLFSLFYNDDFTPNIKINELTPSQKGVLSEKINTFLNQLSNKNKQSFIDNKIFTYFGDRLSFDRNIYKNYLSEYNESIETLNSDTKMTIFKNIVADYTVNGLIGKIEDSKIFNGAIANHKNIIDYFKRGAKTYIDGKALSNWNNKPEFKVAVLQDMETMSPYLNEMSEAVKSYYSGDKINQADAQAYITPERWKFILEGLGQFGKKEQIIYNKMQNINSEFTSKELKTLSTKPLKGVHYQNLNNETIYLKYSQAVLMPNLVKGTPMEKLLKQMRKQDVDEVIMNSGVKVGARLMPYNVTDKLLNNESFELAPITLDNRFWKLQQDLPNKGFKSTLLGSQIQKNIFNNFNFNNPIPFKFNNKTFTAKEIFNNVHNVIGEMSDRGIAKIVNKFSIGSDFKINNWESFANEIADQLKQEKVNDNIIKAVQKELTPYVIPQAKDKVLSTIMSLIRTAAIKLKTNGGSLIQMSNFGLDQNLAEETGILWLKDKAQLAEPKKILQEDGKPLIFPGQVFISGNIIGQYIPNWRDYSLDELFGEDRKGGILPKEILQMIGYRIPNQAMSSNDALEIVGILPDSYIDTIVPYTGITTKTGSDFDIDKMFIMLPSLKTIYTNNTQLLKDFYTGNTLKESTELLGDLLDEYNIDNQMTDEEIIEWMFSDNIENLISIKNDFKNQVINEILKDSKLSKEFRKKHKDDIKIEKVIYEEYDDSKDLTSQTSGSLNNRLFEMYHSILTHSDTYDQLMTPIDVPYLKDFIVKELFPNKVILNNYEAFNPFYQIDLKYEFIAGKFGIGQVANQLVDSVMNQFAQEELNYYLGWGNYKEVEKESEIKKITVFDMKSENGIYDETNTYLITDTLTALLNAFVDIAKDPYITRGNWNTQTTNTGAMLIRAGVNPKKVAAFLAQPALSEMVRIISEREGVVATEGSSSKVVEELMKDYSKKLLDLLQLPKEEEDILIKEISSNTFNNNIVIDGIITSNRITERSTELLKNHIHNTSNKAQFYLDQFLALKEYEALKPTVKEFTKSVTSAKYGETGMGKNLVDYIIRSNKTSDVMFKGAIKNFDKKFYNTEFLDKGLTSLGHYHKNTEQFFSNLIEANPKIFVTANSYFKNIANELASEANKNRQYLDDESVGKTIEQAFYSLLIAGSDLFKLSNDIINIDNRQVNKDFIYLFTKSNKYVQTTLSDEITKLKNDEQFKNNYLIKNLEIKEDNNYSFIGIDGIRRKPNDFTEKIIEGWRELDKIYPEISKSLAKYSFIQSGFKYNSNQIYQYLPHEILIKNNFNSYINKITDLISTEGLDKNIIKESIIRNNWNNSRLVPIINSDDINSDFISRGDQPLVEFDENFSWDDIQNIEVEESIDVVSLALSFDSEKYSHKIENTKIFPKFINYNNNLFQLIGYSKGASMFDLDKTYPVYIKTYKLGYKSDKGQIQEYNLFGQNKSSIKDNNLTEKEQELIDETLNRYNSLNDFLTVEEYESQFDFSKIKGLQNLNITNFNLNTNIEQNIETKEQTEIIEEVQPQQLFLFDENDLNDLEDPCKQ